MISIGYLPGQWDWKEEVTLLTVKLVGKMHTGSLLNQFDREQAMGVAGHGTDNRLGDAKCLDQ